MFRPGRSVEDGGFLCLAVESEMSISDYLAGLERKFLVPLLSHSSQKKRVKQTKKAARVAPAAFCEKAWKALS